MDPVMLKEIFINVTAGSTRIAITENKELVELFFELPDYQRMVGNIYKGKIQNILPGMQATFVDIGHELNAFLPFSEIGNSEFMSNLSFDDEDDESPSPRKKGKPKEINPAKDFKIGDDILVQVIKEPYGEKGPRVTTNISIPGSLMVVVPNNNYIGISRKIDDKYEKRRLRSFAKEIKPAGAGLILRTIAEGKDDKILQHDFKLVMENYRTLNHRVKNRTAPIIVYEDYETVDQVIRDLFTSDISKMEIDDKTLYKRLYSYVKTVSPDQISCISQFKSKGTVFDNYNIETQIEKCLKQKVWMKSGAHLVIEQTEAMLVIDINSGRFIGKKDHEQNSMAINLESAKEIARQLRIRDTGGLIVIDFIDLLQAKNRKKVYDEFRKHLKRDRAKVSVSEFSNFGLLEMTRQRIRASLMATLSEECELCSGVGRIASKDTVITSIENWVKRFKKKANDKRLVIHLHPTLYNYIKENKPKLINKMMWNNWLYLEFEEDNTILRDKFKVYSKKRKNFITENI